MLARCSTAATSSPVAGTSSPCLRAPRRIGPAIESSAYFVIAEALSNIAKHSLACSASVTAQIQDGRLVVEVCDDGVGGAQPDGSGLRGIADRVGAFGGHVQIESQPSRGTSIIASFPLRRSEHA